MAHLNEVHMTEDSATGNIAAVGSFTISPSNIVRACPWGAAANVSPNPVDSTDADSNSEIISIGNAVRAVLDSADVRANYIMTGATWTIDGGAFDSNFGNPGNSGIVTGHGVGTSQMANTTTETYQQILDPVTHRGTYDMFSNNCVTCHEGNRTSVSHIFSTPGASGHGLKPLF